MGGNSRGPLTEPMFYVLMSFLRRDMCGTEITEFVERKTRGRVKLGPGTLYTLLGKFQDEKLIQETEVDGRKRTYRITPKGRAVYQEEVDRLRHIMNGGKGVLAEIEAKEKERTGIRTLKIGYNKVFGYYIEVSNSFKDQVPEDYVRRQTLTNSER